MAASYMVYTSVFAGGTTGAVAQLTWCLRWARHVKSNAAALNMVCPVQSMNVPQAQCQAERSFFVQTAHVTTNAFQSADPHYPYPLVLE
jgi:hypothetical protein